MQDLTRQFDAAMFEIYRRAKELGRMMPEGLEYVSSWVDLEFKTCYQLMRRDDASLFDEWTSAWNDLSRMPGDSVDGNEEEREQLMEAFERQYWDPRFIDGAIPICHLGCALRQLLVITGPEAGNDLESYPASREVVDGVHEVAQIAAEPVELPDDERVTVSQSL